MRTVVKRVRRRPTPGRRPRMRNPCRFSSSEFSDRILPGTRFFWRVQGARIARSGRLVRNTSPSVRGARGEPDTNCWFFQRILRAADKWSGHRECLLARRRISPLSASNEASCDALGNRPHDAGVNPAVPVTLPASGEGRATWRHTPPLPTCPVPGRLQLRCGH